LLFEQLIRDLGIGFSHQLAGFLINHISSDDLAKQVLWGNIQFIQARFIHLQDMTGGDTFFFLYNDFTAALVLDIEGRYFTP